MAQLSDTIVTGKLAVTGKIYEGGTALDAKFAAGIGRSGNTIQILNANGNAISSLNLPLGAIKVEDGSFTLDSRSESNNVYTWTGSKAIAWDNDTVTHTDGWVSSTQFTGGTISASLALDKSYVIYKTGNSDDTTSSYNQDISDVDPNQTVTIKAGFYPTDRTLAISKADIASEVVGGIATISSALTVNSGGTLPSFSDTEISGGYTVSIQPSYSVTTAGYTGTGTVSGTATTFYVKKGSVTSSVSGTNPTFTISKTGTFVDNASTYGITTYAPSSGTDGTNYLTLAVDGSSNSKTFTATMSLTDGYIESKGTQGTKSVSASKAGDGSYYVPIVTPAFDGGGVSSSISSLSGTSITLGDTNNGIAVTATPQASRTAVLYNGAKKGLINIADNTKASAAVGNTAGTAATKYVSAITVPSGKTLPTVTNDGGTITSLANNGTISTLSVPSGGTSTISAVSGTHTITSNTGTLTISHGTQNSGNVTVKPYNSTTSYSIIVNGAVQKASIPNLTISGSGSASVSTSSTNVSYSTETTQPATGYYISVAAEGSVSGLTATNASGITAGWLDAIDANTILGNAGSITVSSDTKYLAFNTLTGTNTITYGDPAIGNLTSGTISKIGNTETTGYYFNVPTSASFKTTNNGYRAQNATYGSGDKTQRYSISAGSVTTGVSGTKALSVTLSKTGTFVNASNMTAYGITSGTAPTSGTDGTNFLTLTLSGDSPSSTLSGTKSVTDGYVKTANVTANGATISASMSGGTSYYVPIVTPAFDGGGLTGGGLSQSGNSGGGLSWDNANVTVSDTDNGIRIKTSRADFSNTVTRAKVDRAAVLYNGAKKGLINIADNTQALAAGSISSDSSTVSLTGTSITKYLTAVNMPKDVPFSVTMDADTALDSTSTLSATLGDYRMINISQGGTANNTIHGKIIVQNDQDNVITALQPNRDNYGQLYVRNLWKMFLGYAPDGTVPASVNKYITYLYMRGYSTSDQTYITSLDMDNKSYIGRLIGTGTIKYIGNDGSAATLTIEDNVNGTVNIWNTGGDKGVRVTNHLVKVDGTIVTDANGDLTTTSLTAGNGSLVAESGVTLSDYLTTTSTNNYGGFYGYGNVSVGTGWISGTNTDSNASSTYYIKAGGLSAGSGSLSAITNVTLGDYLTTTATGNYGGFVGKGSAKVGTAGWLAKDTSKTSSDSDTYYIKAGALANISGGGLTHSNTTFTSDYLTSTNTGYAVTASNTASVSKITAGVTTAGWIPTSASKEVSATGDDVKSATEYVIAGELSDISGGGLNHSNTTFTAGTDYLTDTDTGLAVTASNTASRDAISAGVTTAGWIPTSASKSVNATSDSTKTVTKYIKTTSITVTGGGTTATATLADSQTNAILSSTNISGIKIHAGATADRAAVKVTNNAGWLDAHSATTYVGSEQDNDSVDKYLSAITLPDGDSKYLTVNTYWRMQSDANGNLTFSYSG